METPNIVLIMTDQHVHDAIGCAGNDTIETPNIDQLSQTGVHFENAYCPSPTCGPSRASIFSGTYPSYHGVTTNNRPYDREAEIDLLPMLLNDAGYETGLVGKLHLTPKNCPHGFGHKELHDSMYTTYDEEEPWTSDYVQWLAEKRFNGNISEVIRRANQDEEAFKNGKLRQFLLGSNWRTPDEHSNTWTAERSCDYIQDHSGDGDPPFFLFSSFFGPHQPMKVPEKWHSLYDPDEIELPETFSTDLADKPIAQLRNAGSGVNAQLIRRGWSDKQYKQILAAYYAQITMIDDQVGKIIDALKEENLYNDTIVIFTSDHGEHAGQFRWFFKGSLYENSVKVPLIVSGSDKLPTKRIAEPVSNLCLYPTLLEFADIDIPEKCSTRSVKNSITGSDNIPGIVYAEQNNERMLVTEDGKLISGEDQSGAKAFELYTDLGTEQINRWEDPDYKRTQERLLTLLEQAEKSAERGMHIPLPE